MTAGWLCWESWFPWQWLCAGFLFWSVLPSGCRYSFCAGREAAGEGALMGERGHSVTYWLVTAGCSQLLIPGSFS